LWASTNSGISHVELSVPQTVFNTRNGIDGIVISSFYHQGQFYVGTYQHVLKQIPFQYSIKQDVPQFAPIPDSPGEIWQFKDISGDLMIASGRGLFQVLDNKTLRIAESGTDGYALGTSQRWPNYLFMGKMGGLELFHRENGSWKLAGKFPQIKDNIRRITADASGDLWLSTEVQPPREFTVRKSLHGQMLRTPRNSSLSLVLVHSLATVAPLSATSILMNKVDICYKHR
jgi:ligand-binding sensor domain-containing protein